MNEQQEQIAALQPPTTNDRGEWKVYWEAQEMPWRTEPEIDEERQQYLAKRRAVESNIEKSTYPFRDENGSIKLTRADVEWLLATNINGSKVGPVSWSAFSKLSWLEIRMRAKGIDLRGANLIGVNLAWLPLTLMSGGLSGRKMAERTEEELEAAAVHLEGANLTGTHLEGAALRSAHLEGAILKQARLDRARLQRTHLEGASLELAHLEGTQLGGTNLQARILTESQLQAIRRWKSDFPQVLLPADLGDSYCDSETKFVFPILAPSKGCEKYGSTLLADIHWGDANLGIVDWTTVRRIGNEYIARSGISHSGQTMDKPSRMRAYLRTVRTYRQLASILRSQGLGEPGDTFAYRAQLWQRYLFRRQHHYLRYLGSWLMWLIAGYGYKPMRSLIAYISIICVFAGAFLINAQFAAPHLTWDEALVLSVSAFHGRGFFTSGISLGDTLARLAAGEAIIGLLIEITFIATFTQRFFAR
jgi:uncharacterized protein YjbI with pentapeptide repeats